MSGNTDPPFRLFVIAGEASGDLLAASFVAELAARIAPRRLHILGIGGKPLEELGLQPLLPQTDIQLMGIIAVLRRLPTLLSHISTTVDAIIDQKPDLLLTVDVPDFSMRVSRRMRRHSPDIPIIHWVAPTVWAWRPGRARAIRPYVDHVLALLPFEPEVMLKLGGPPTTYVGHPLLDMIATIRPDEAEQRLRNNGAAPVILILPGSRRSEIRHLLPVFRSAVSLIAARYPHATFVLPAVDHLAGQISADVATWPVKPEVVVGEAAKHAAFRRARVALAASGTVTLELALAGIPLVGAYRGHPVEAWLARRLIRTSTVLLCNIVLGRNVVPEYMQREADPRTLAQAVMAVLEDTAARQEQIKSFSEIDALMGLPSGQRTASAAVDIAMDLVARHRGQTQGLSTTEA